MTDLATLLSDAPWRQIRMSYGETWLVTASGVPLAKLEQPEVAGTLLGRLEHGVTAPSRPEGAALTFELLRGVNVRRCVNGFGHTLDSWSVAEWTNAAAGEMGEACNVAKKMLRHRDNVLGNAGEDNDLALLRKKLARELSDTIIYGDLVAASQGIDLGEAVRETFNRKSEEIGSAERLPEPLPILAGAVERLVRAARAVGRITLRFPTDEQWRVPVAELVAAAQAVGGTDERGVDRHADSQERLSGAGVNDDGRSACRLGTQGSRKPPTSEQKPPASAKPESADDSYNAPIPRMGVETAAGPAGAPASLISVVDGKPGRSSVAPASSEPPPFPLTLQPMPAYQAPPAPPAEPAPEDHAGGGAPVVWRCESCGKEFYADPGIGHSRADHAPSCDGNCRSCPVEVQCGPITLWDRGSLSQADGHAEPLTIQPCSRCGIEVPWDDTRPVVCYPCECPDHPSGPIAFDARVRLNLATSESRIDRYAALGTLVVDALGPRPMGRSRVRVTVKRDYVVDGIGCRAWARKVYLRHFVDECGRVRQ